jgi:hypothetical protein
MSSPFIIGQESGGQAPAAILLLGSRVSIDPALGREEMPRLNTFRRSDLDRVPKALPHAERTATPTGKSARRDPVARVACMPRPADWVDDDTMTLRKAVAVFWPDGLLTGTAQPLRITR